MARNFIVLCENVLKEIVADPYNASAPQADPKPIIAGHVLGTYASPEIAEQALIEFAKHCPSRHFILEAKHDVTR